MIPVVIGFKAQRLFPAKLMLVVSVLCCLAPHVATACSVCYGEPDSPASKGLTWAIVALAAIVVCVLAGIVSFFVVANNTAAALALDAKVTSGDK